MPLPLHGSDHPAIRGSYFFLPSFPFLSTIAYPRKGCTRVKRGIFLPTERSPISSFLFQFFLELSSLRWFPAGFGPLGKIAGWIDRRVRDCVRLARKDLPWCAIASMTRQGCNLFGGLRSFRVASRVFSRAGLFRARRMFGRGAITRSRCKA